MNVYEFWARQTELLYKFYEESGDITTKDYFDKMNELLERAEKMIREKTSSSK